MRMQENQAGNWRMSVDGSAVADEALSSEDLRMRLVRLLQAPPQQQVLVDEILAGRLPAPAPARPPAPEPEPYIDKKEAARRLGIKTRTLDDWMRRRLIVYYKVGRSCRFKWSEIERHLAETCRVGGRSR
jgi:excisionase family DNA binding protein